MYDKLIFILMALYGSLKDYHYRAKGVEFYSNHLLADRIIGESANLLENIDAIQEVCFLGRGEDSKSWAEIFEGSKPFVVKISDTAGHAKAILGLLAKALDEIENIRKKDIPAGEDNLMTSISQGLQQSNGFLIRVVK